MPPTPGTPCHVLVVEDDPWIMQMIQALLETRGFEPIPAADAMAAIHHLRDTVTLPQVILLDLQLPGMSGQTFLNIQQASPEWSSIPVILMSAGNNIPAVQQQFAIQASLRKPFDPEQMLDLVASFCS